MSTETGGEKDKLLYLKDIDEYRKKFSEPLSRLQACEVLLDERFPDGIEGGEKYTFKDMLRWVRSDEYLMELIEDIKEGRL